MRTDDVERVDVLIVGAGLSGIGAGCHLRRDCPERAFAILEARDAIGGTWDLFRYPGIRSDSDMQTLGYAFAPWKGAQTIADGPSILGYVRQTAAEYGVEERVRCNRRVVSADYDSRDCTWTVQVQETNGSHPPETTEMRCSFLFMCTGDYRYDEGYTPPFPGVDRFQGTLVRWKNVALMALSYQLSRRRPRLVKAVIRRGARSQLPEGFDVDTHFAPLYDPWDQRLCVAPDADLFKALHAGTASVVTDRIVTFTERGLKLAGGSELEADVIVTATGLRLQAIGGTALSVDGVAVHLPDTLAYKGMMLSGVPNFALTIGYTNASWTLKADLTADYMCRLLNHMAAHGYRQCMPEPDPQGVTRRPLIDLASGYVQRAIGELPAQGSERPWQLRQNYPLDMLDFRRAELDDGVMQFSAGRRAPRQREPAAA